MITVPPVDVSKLFGSVPIGPLRDKRVVDISAKDFEETGGFVCQVNKAGDITYRAFEGERDQTETLEAGATVNLGGLMVLLKIVRASAAIGSITIGRL